jgi:hypothetical protein
MFINKQGNDDGHCSTNYGKTMGGRDTCLVQVSGPEQQGQTYMFVGRSQRQLQKGTQEDTVDHHPRAE